VYGLIGKIMAVSGKRDELLEIMLSSISSMSGCLSYVVAKDRSDENVLWLTEVWETEASYRASVLLRSVQAIVTKARPLIAGFASLSETEPMGGLGL
jgi:quinol monooxygenase YgiN